MTTKLKQADLVFFKSIKIDSLYLYIKPNKYLLNHELGIYNQTKEILGRIKKSELLDTYIAEIYKVAKVNANAVMKWEESLFRESKPSFYAHMFRVKRINNTHVEVYARVLGSNVLDRVTDSKLSSMYKDIKSYCEFWEYANSWCLENDVINPADISISSVKSDFRAALLGGLIPCITDIKVLSNNPDEYCLAYYDLNSGSLENPTPAWDSFLSQMMNDECRATYRAWVYSVYVGDNFGRQILHVHGVGETGKSATANVIMKGLQSLNPHIVTALEAMNNADKFSLASYQQKRFALAADSTDRTLVRNNLVKNLTGDDTVAIREMNKAKDYAQVYCKIMVTSNKTPFVNTDSPEELSRLILISLVPDLCVKAKNDWYKNYAGVNWQKKLAQELPDFIRQSKRYYDERLKPDGNLKDYDGHFSVLETSKYFVVRDLPVWFKSCIIQTDDPSDFIKLSELGRDYERFLRGEMWVDGAMRWAIKISVLKFLRSINANIMEMKHFNSIFLVGYRFKEEDKALRDTASQIIIEQLKEELSGNDN